MDKLSACPSISKQEPALNTCGNRPTRAVIDLSALRHNYLNIKDKVGGKGVLAVVKANAYGHGAVAISAELERLGADFLGVAIVREGIELRNSGITAPILVLNGIFEGEEGDVIKHDLTSVVYSLESVRRLSEAALKYDTPVRVHVKVDTGMRRLGIRPDDVPIFFKTMKSLQNLSVEGMLSHFATADSRDKTFREKQIKEFTNALQHAVASGCKPRFVHIANSAAIIYDDLPEYLNLVRPGISLYGSYPSLWMKDEIGLEPVMTLKSSIIQIKKVLKGESVSYTSKYTVDRDSMIGVVPAGYADGYPRNLANKGQVVVKGRITRVVGLVCMDLLMIDLTDIPGVDVGDEVILWGKEGSSHIPVEDLARQAGTISYELFCRVSGRVPRDYRNV